MSTKRRRAPSSKSDLTPTRSSKRTRLQATSEPIKLEHDVAEPLLSLPTLSDSTPDAKPELALETLQHTTPPPDTKPAPKSTPRKSKKLANLAAYASASPFPDWQHPTSQDARAVFDILLAVHPLPHVARSAPPPSSKLDFADVSTSVKAESSSTTTSSSLPTTEPESNSAKTCGQTRDPIDALIGTILSQNTSGANSSRAKASLDATFGKNNFAAIASAPRADLVAAIHSGGMAAKKATTIQNLLASIKLKHNAYSLDHLRNLSISNADVMRELVAFDGVGPKTAACVLLFCLGRPAFAVDTHVFRLSRVLGWVPPSATRVTAQAHLDLRIPDDLKYGLHVLMVTHGRACRGCKGSGGAKGKGGEGCPLKAHVRSKASAHSVDEPEARKIDPISSLSPLSEL
ncbi:hypothetical protein HGRIS_011904 [Hohenbuehelia grisea]|uniref:HhH-GPD domain-containing protein n=1 Tax=Hohenbuehelia grisea TaxID=104357 RepID=A0ABR3JXL4_9AGAR